MRNKVLLLTAVLCFSPVLALAAPVLYTLTGVTFGDGGTASGSFVYDSATNTYSSINITTTAGTVRTSGATYHFIAGNPNPPSSSFSLNLTTAFANNQTGLPGLALLFGTALGAAGTSSLVGSQEANCSDAVCSTPVAPMRFTTAGNVTGQALQIPTLSEWGMAAFSILLMGTAVLYLRKREVQA